MALRVVCSTTSTGSAPLTIWFSSKNALNSSQQVSQENISRLLSLVSLIRWQPSLSLGSKIARSHLGQRTSILAMLRGQTAEVSASFAIYSFLVRLTMTKWADSCPSCEYLNMYLRRWQWWLVMGRQQQMTAGLPVSSISLLTWSQHQQGVMCLSLHQSCLVYQWQRPHSHPAPTPKTIAVAERRVRERR